MNTTKQQELVERMNKLQVMSELVSRMGLAAKLGLQTFNGQRDIYNALGYPKEISYADYYLRYKRQDLAKAIIDKPANATWRGDWKVQEGSHAENTEFEKTFAELQDTLHLQTLFTRLDKLVGLGRYAVLLIGTNDLTVQDDWAKPVVAGKELKITYVKPYSEQNAKIEKTVADGTSERYGFPEYYLIGEKQIRVHWSRVIHVTDQLLEDEIYGIPRMEAVFNRLLDVEKITGGDAEMFWRGARPGYQGKLDSDYQMSPKMQEELEKQLDEYEHNLRRILVNEGIDYKALEQQISDPLNHLEIQIQMISAETGIPKRILVGSERGELASSQDAKEWKEYIQHRRKTFAEEKIVRPFVDWIIKYRLIPEPQTGKYEIEWEDLFAMSEKDRVDIGKARADALKSYTTQPMAESIVPPDAFLRYFLGLNDVQLEQIESMLEAQVKQIPKEEE